MCTDDTCSRTRRAHRERCADGVRCRELRGRRWPRRHQLVRLQRAGRRLRQGRGRLHQAGRRHATRSSYVKLPTDAEPAARAARPPPRRRGRSHRHHRHGRDLDRPSSPRPAGSSRGPGATATAATRGQASPGPLKTAQLQGQALRRPVHDATRSCSGTARTASTQPPEDLGRDDRRGREDRPDSRSRSRRNRYEGLIVWFNSLIASARAARSSTRPANGRRSSDADRARRRDRWQARQLRGGAARHLDQRPRTRRASASRPGDSAFKVNYPFVYPSAKDERARRSSRRWAAARYPRVDAGQAQPRRRSAASTSASAPFSKHPDLAFEAAECLAQRRRTSSTRAELGGLPPTHRGALRRRRRSRRPTRASPTCCASRSRTPRRAR